ncbi:response regulator transcription factor [Flaviaesturariibacter amylovorans]|uniref:Response regulator transcription factor n=1 Tax=Flaviaesturariibacter amylovorans TaxID=1084520 RepID=A0ABP8HQX9_9BACT
MTYRILLADDHPFLLNGIQSMLGELPDVEIAGTATNGTELLGLVARLHPDLVLIDLNMPGSNGLDCLHRIRSAHPSVRVLIFTSYQQAQLVEEARRSGAAGYVYKTASPDELRAAVLAVLAGGTFFPDTQRAAPDEAPFYDDFLKKYQLTRREAEIIRLIVRGGTSRQIAGELHLSELTVNTHRKNIMRKLEVGNIAGLVSFGRANNLY